MNIYNRIRDSFKAAFLTFKGSIPMSGYGGISFQNNRYREADPFGGRFLAGTNVNYEKEAGELTQHGLVMAMVNWLGTQMTEAPLRVYKQDTQKQPKEQVDHKLHKLMMEPNSYYEGPLLYKAFALSWIIDGNVYFWKERDQLNRVKGIWYLPHFSITPLFPVDATGGTFITGYAYRVDGKDYLLPKEDVVHFRYNFDPLNLRKGLSPLGSLYRELYSDNQRANYSASLLRNFGIPGVVISPSSDTNIIDEESRNQLKNDFKRKFGGDNLGEPLVASAGVKVDILGFEPEKMALDALAAIPEERISAVLGIPAAVVGFGAGLKYTNYATMRELREQAYEGVVIPTQKQVAGVINHQLLPDFDGENPDTYCEFDLSEVRVLQEDAEKKTNRIAKLWNDGVIMRAQALAALGFPVDKQRDMVYKASAGTALIPEELADGQSLLPTISVYDQQQAAAGGPQGGGQTWPPKQGQSAQGQIAQGPPPKQLAQTTNGKPPPSG